MKKLVIIMTLILCGCTDATIQSVKALGSKHIIHLYSGGKEVGLWESTGSVDNEQGGAFTFKDDATGKLVQVYGTIVVEQK